MIYNLFLVFAVFTSGFVFWKRGKEEHFAEDQLFDGFLLSVIVGFIVARIFFILLHFDSFGWSVVTWLNIFSHGGLALPFGVIATIFSLTRFSKTNNWDVFGILDMWMPGLLIATSIQQIGVFVQGQSPTVNLPFFAFPITLFIGGLLLGASRYLYWLEYRYRTFAWYKSGQDTAKTGFIFAVGLIILGILFISTLSVKSAGNRHFEQIIMFGVYGSSLFAGLMLLFKRSGTFTTNKKRK